MKQDITLTVNGEIRELRVDVKDLLLQVLREKLGLTGTKEGCGTGECGACTVLVDDVPMNACLYLAVRADGKRIMTIEGLADGNKLHPLQRAFVDNAAVQCGFCGPGVLLSAKALLDRNPCPSEHDIRQGIAGNICRCSGYTKIVKAVQQAAEVINAERQNAPGPGGVRPSTPATE
jgi:aerobic carbon-monoxide dehydrogenase small subunit